MESGRSLEGMTEEEILEEIERFISTAPVEYQESLRRTQWKCDSIRRKYKDNPTGSMFAIQKLMWDSVTELTDALQELKDESNTK